MALKTLPVLVYLAVACCSFARANTRGTEFFFAFFPEKDVPPGNNSVNDVYISSTLDTDCTLSFDDSIRKAHQVHIPAGGIVTEQLPDTTQLTIGTKVENKGIYLYCSNPVWAYAQNRMSQHVIQSSDSYTIVPLQSLSTEYLIPSISDSPFIGVVATTSNTTVKVHLQSYSCKIIYKNTSYTTGQDMTFTLNTNDVLQIVHSPFKLTTRYDCDFAGTLIESSEPTAVFSGAIFFNVSNRMVSHLVFQVPPLSAYSTTAIVPHIPSPAYELNIRVMASQDNTTVSMTSQPEWTAQPDSLIKQRGKIIGYGYDAKDDLVIRSDKPILVVQNTFFSPSGGLSMFIPGINTYEKEYIVQSFLHDQYNKQEMPVLTIVSETSQINNTYVNGVVPSGMKWRLVKTTNYSIGTLEIKELQKYHVTCPTPIFVTLHQFVDKETYGYIGGYHLPAITDAVSKAVHLQCHHDNWYLTVDMDQLSLHPKDIYMDIYLGIPTCTGTLLGNQLVFNVSYVQCHTTQTVAGGKLVFKNSLWYAPLSSDKVIRDIQWVDDITCSHPQNGTDSVHIYPNHNTTNHVTTSGQIQGTPVTVSLFKDVSFQTPFIEDKDKAELGKPIFVQVSASATHSLLMLVNSCQAHLTTDPGNSVSHPLISKGCPVDKKTQILATRNTVTRFKFEMFTLPRETDGIYVTCDVTFCSTADFSPQCQLGCHSAQFPGVIG